MAAKGFYLFQVLGEVRESEGLKSCLGLGESMGICIENAKNLAKSGEFTICALANRGAPYTSQVPRGYT